jgi:hypothetical protein
MTRKARLWTGVTLLIVIAFNYMLIGFPLVSKSTSIESRAKAIIISQSKQKNIFKKGDDEYILQVLKKEKAAIDRNVVILNCVAASLSFIIVSWTIFGIIFHRRD